MLKKLWAEYAALALLAPVYARYTEGFATPDLILARQTLDQCLASGAVN